MQNEEIIKILTADYPAVIWYVPSLVLVLLAIASLVDARTGRVPDSIIGLGLLGALGSLAWYAGCLSQANGIMSYGRGCHDRRVSEQYLSQSFSSAMLLVW